MVVGIVSVGIDPAIRIGGLVMRKTFIVIGVVIGVVASIVWWLRPVLKGVHGSA
jgi:type III secretory pathway component EscT